MKLYLTSATGGEIKKDGIRYPAPIFRANNFIDHLMKHWKQNSKMLLIASDPKDIQKSDDKKLIYMESFPKSGLSISKIDVCDSRNELIVDKIYEYDVIMLLGGHVPTQNAFFKKIQLKKKLEGYNGIILAISAGTMNCAEIVYNHPELEGESLNHDDRFISGLGYTKLMILPHYQMIKNDMLDGKRVIEDIAYLDSMGKEFLCLVDGSYVYCENGHETLYGEAYLIKDGELSQICWDNEYVVLK